MTALAIIASLIALTLALIGVVKRGYADRFIAKLGCKECGHLFLNDPGKCAECDDDREGMQAW